jgi:hypothetical protein
VAEQHNDPEILGDDDEELAAFFSGERDFSSTQVVIDGGKGLAPGKDNDNGLLLDENPSEEHPGIEGAERLGGV